MAVESRLSKMLTTTRAPREVQDWIFSLTPQPGGSHSVAVRGRAASPLAIS